jgi:CRISPR/Cas system endoribonuclease Cas6 (RAMP superfamily)
MGCAVVTRRRGSSAGDWIGRVLREQIDAKDAEANRKLCHEVLCQLGAAIAIGLLGELAYEASAQVEPYFRDKWRLDERCHGLGVPR